MPLPNFFIAGAGKEGTTSLYEHLNRHPGIYMSPVKEPCYFVPEIRAKTLAAPIQRHVRLQSRELPKVLHDGVPVKPLGWLAGDWKDYLRLFQHARGEKAIGEASAAYLWSKTAARHFQAAVPGARIILILRDPALFLVDVFAFLGVDATLGVDPSLRSLERRGPRAVAAHYFLKKLRSWSPLRSLVPERVRPRLRRLAFTSGHSLRMDPGDRAFLIDYLPPGCGALVGIAGPGSGGVAALSVKPRTVSRRSGGKSDSRRHPAPGETR